MATVLADPATVATIIAKLNGVLEPLAAGRDDLDDTVLLVCVAGLAAGEHMRRQDVSEESAVEWATIKFQEMVRAAYDDTAGPPMSGHA